MKEIYSYQVTNFPLIFEILFIIIFLIFPTGPGQYDTDLKATAAINVSKGQSIPRDPRFRAQKAVKMPGPADYTVRNYHLLFCFALVNIWEV